MGYDVYGLNPKQNTEEPAILSKFANEDGFNDWSLMNDDDKKAYFDAQDTYRGENPGEYYRANVWYWRPVWNFVCAACDDFLSNKDIDAGCSNSGGKISKTKANRMGSRLKKLDKQGVIQKWEDEMMVPFNKAQKNNKQVRKEMNAFQEKMKKKHGEDIVPGNYPKDDYAKWNEIYAREDWGGSYPPSRRAIVEFGRFCAESGGFEVW
tara:strand:+ start:85 stop:708 length:624 start_codon:yes stop_codon:yes gene_type:complete